MPPRPVALAPSAGLGNGTLVTVNGSGAWQAGLQTLALAPTRALTLTRAPALALALALALTVALRPSPGPNPNQAGLQTRCRFGNAVVNASRVDADSDADADSVRCAAPAAREAGAWARVALGFSEAWAAELQEAEAELHGAAAVVAGQLRLTTHRPAFTREGPLGADAARGSLVLSLPQPALPPRSFRASFQLRMGGGTGADGFSFSYGDLPAGPIGELGAGDGLRICWRTHSLMRLEVRSP